MAEDARVVHEACAIQLLHGGFSGARFLHEQVTADRWGVTLANLQGFFLAVEEKFRAGALQNVGRLYDESKFRSPSIGPNMYQVNEQVITPLTADTSLLLPGVSWALSSSPPLARVTHYVTHAWAEGVFEFRQFLMQAWPYHVGNASAYICFLSNPQNLDIQAMLSSIETSPFYVALRNMPANGGMIMIATENIPIHTRLWCVFEAHMAMRHGIPITLVGVPANLATDRSAVAARFAKYSFLKITASISAAFAGLVAAAVVVWSCFLCHMQSSPSRNGKEAEGECDQEKAAGREGQGVRRVAKGQEGRVSAGQRAQVSFNVQQCVQGAAWLAPVADWLYRMIAAIRGQNNTSVRIVSGQIVRGSPRASQLPPGSPTQIVRSPRASQVPPGSPTQIVRGSPRASQVPPGSPTQIVRSFPRASQVPPGSPTRQPSLAGRIALAPPRPSRSLPGSPTRLCLPRASEGICSGRSPPSSPTRSPRNSEAPPSSPTSEESWRLSTPEELRGRLIMAWVIGICLCSLAVGVIQFKRLDDITAVLMIFMVIVLTCAGCFHTCKVGKQIEFLESAERGGFINVRDAQCSSLEDASRIRASIAGQEDNINLLLGRLILRPDHSPAPQLQVTVRDDGAVLHVQQSSDIASFELEARAPLLHSPFA